MVIEISTDREPLWKTAIPVLSAGSPASISRLYLEIDKRFKA